MLIGASLAFAMYYHGVSTAPRPFVEPVRLLIAPRPSQRHRDPLPPKR